MNGVSPSDIHQRLALLPLVIANAPGYGSRSYLFCQGANLNEHFDYRWVHKSSIGLGHLCLKLK
jgi:hypothetical protein